MKTKEVVPMDRRFMATASKSQAKIAGELAEQIQALIYTHSETIPLALAIGVLRIVESELLENNA